MMLTIDDGGVVFFVIVVGDVGGQDEGRVRKDHLGAS